jgi:hypothetical protein
LDLAVRVAVPEDFMADRSDEPAPERGLF